MNNIKKKNIKIIKPFIFTKKVNNKQIIIPLSIKTRNTLGPIRHFPPATKEWFNSVYAYNKNYIKNLSIANNNLSNIIKSYFNFYFNKKVLQTKRIATRFIRLGMKNIFISKAEIKHTNEKVIITLYIYNEEKRILIRKIEKLEKILFPSKFYARKNKPLSIIEKLNLINCKENTLFTVKLKKILSLIINKIKVFQKRMLLKKENRNYLKELSLIFKLKKYFKKIVNILKICVNNTPFIEYYEKVFYEAKYKILLKKEIKRIVYYRLLLDLNKSKFEDKFLLILKPLISKIYNKEVEFNIVNLKTMALDSNIFTQAIALKLKNRNNKLLRVLRRSLKMIVFPSRIILREGEKHSNTNSYELKHNITKLLHLGFYEKLDDIFQKFDESKDNLNKILFLFNDFSTYNSISKQTLLNITLNTIKYKSLAGARLEAKGRLTRRFTASRSVFKLRWKGSLKNFDSSYKGLSSVILRGHIKPNVQYSIVNSKTRNGAFGLKGWVSGK